MGERLDLNGLKVCLISDAFVDSESWAAKSKEVLAEALRAQASEDALKERVRELEEFLQKPIVVLPIALDIGDDGAVAEILRKIIEGELNKYAKRALTGQEVQNG